MDGTPPWPSREEERGADFIERQNRVACLSSALVGRHGLGRVVGYVVVRRVDVGLDVAHVGGGRGA